MVGGGHKEGGDPYFQYHLVLLFVVCFEMMNAFLY